MDSVDLEVDGAPAVLHNLKQLTDEGRCDSAYGSSISSLSTDSGCLKDIREQISRHYTDKNKVCDNLNEIKESEPCDEITKKLGHLDVQDIDEGICCSCTSVEECSNENSDCQSTCEGERVSVPNLATSACRPKQETDTLTEEALVVYGKDADGDTLLHLAIIQGQINLAKVFIEIAPWSDWLDIYNDKLRQTPLHLAALMGQLDVVRSLLAHGANREMFDHNGDTALHIACRNRNIAMVNELLKSSDNNTFKHNGKTSKGRQNLEARNYCGQTCLHIATVVGSTQIVDALLKNGANVNAGDGKSGATALHMAAENNKIEIAKILLEQHDIIVDKAMYNAVTPLMIACGRRKADFVELLLRYGAKIEVNEVSNSSSSEDEI